MEMAVCNEKASTEKKRKKRQKRRGNATRGDRRGCNPAADNASTDNTISQESPKKICLNVEPEMGQSHSEVTLLRENNEKKNDALKCKEASGISVSTILNVKVLKEEDGKSTSPNADFCSADGKENSLVPEEPDGEGSSTIKRDNEHTETVDRSTPSNHFEIKRIRKRKHRRRMKRSVESPKKCLASNVEDEKEVAVLGHPHEVETTSHLKHFATSATEEVMNSVLLDEFIDCSISEKAELLPANTNESSMVFADPHKSKDCENITTIKNDKDCLETKDCMGQSNSVGTHGKTKKERKRRRKKREFADTLEGSLNSGVEESKKDATVNCLNEVETTSLHEHSTTTKIVKNVLVEEVSIECSVGELPSEMEREQTIQQTVTHLLACDATNDKVGAVVEKKGSSRISDSSNERDATGCLKKKLLILDVNGLLVDFVPYFPDGYTPDIIISRKAVFKRPFCDDFLQFCFERFEVGIWSSRTWKNLNMLVRFLMRDSRHKLLFCWDQSHCTTTRFTTIENAKKPLLLKELKKIWENLEPNLPWKKGDYDASNTLLLDDSPYKALRNPANTAVFPTTYQYKDSDDTSLGPGGDLRTYLEGVSMTENVQKYVEQNPFGQKPISESSPSWKFYRKVINSEDG